MKFEDFKKNPKDLVGKMVLRTRTAGGISGKKRSVHKIVTVSRGTFTLSGEPELKFSLMNGYKTPYDKWNRDECTLITEEEYEEIKATWELSKQRKELKSKIDVLLSKETRLERLSVIHSVLIQP